MLFSLSKNEILYSIYISAFEQIKKNSDKNDKNYQNICHICHSLNESKKILEDQTQLEKISLVLSHPLEICSNKIIDIILNAFDQIINNELINDYIFQRMSILLIDYIQKTETLNS